MYVAVYKVRISQPDFTFRSLVSETYILYTWRLYIGAEGREFEHRPGSTRNLSQPSSEWVPFFESRMDKALEEKNELCVPYLVPTIKWPSNSQCSYCETP